MPPDYSAGCQWAPAVYLLHPYPVQLERYSFSAVFQFEVSITSLGRVQLEYRSLIGIIGLYLATTCGCKLVIQVNNRDQITKLSCSVGYTMPETLCERAWKIEIKTIDIETVNSCIYGEHCRLRAHPRAKRTLVPIDS